MEKAGEGFDLRISPRWSVALLGLSGAVLLMHSDTMSAESPHRIYAHVLGICLYIAMLLIGVVPLRHTVFPVWATLSAFTAGVLYADHWLHLDGALSFMPLGTILAAAFINLRAAGLVAVGHTALLVLLPRLAPRFLFGTTALPIFATWTALGLAVTIYTPIYQVLAWAWDNYRESQANVAEAREHRANLEGALEDLRQANRQLALNSQRMAALRTAADEAQRSKTAFVSRVSHEFRAPLNMIIGLVGLMVERPEIYAEELPPDLKADLEVIARNTDHLAAMINDVLDLSQTESGQLRLHPEPVQLGELIEDATCAISPLIEHKRLTMVQQLPPDLPTVRCDRTRIRQVLLNLISNAARFTDAGCIRVTASATQQEIIVEVHDTGPGIPAEARARIFEPFYRATVSSHKVSGTGLGLAISREIVRHHGGRIWLESEPSAGASFYFSLPLHSPTPPAAKPGHEIVPDWIWREAAYRTNRTVEAAALARPRIVVHDPEGTLAHEFGRVGQEIEWVETHQVDDSVAALQACPAHALVVNAGSNGIANTSDLAQLQERIFGTDASGTPIIACAVPNPLIRARRAGAVGYLIKPISREALLDTVQHLPNRVRDVLLIDDDTESLSLMQRVLSLMGGDLEIRTAVSGKQAMARLRDQRPDLILLDVILPDTNGWALLEQIRSDRMLRNVPTIFVSAQDPAEQPAVSDYILATVSQGISSHRILACILGLSKALLGESN